MLRVTTLNVNGIRAAFRKGLADWLSHTKPDIVCMQEIKIADADLKEAIRHPGAYTGTFHHAEKKGYSGVGIYALQQANTITSGMGLSEFDAEGRIIRADWPGLTVISAYLPSGSSGDLRQDAKYRFLDYYENWLTELIQDHRNTGREYIICGDWNIAHHEIDLKNWRGNRKNSGFLPEERAWLSKIFDEIGWVDVYRRLYPDTTDAAYTWWSNRGQAWANNTGWRIDYHIATPGIAKLAQDASIYKDERFSDHAPLTIDYDFSLA